MDESLVQIQDYCLGVRGILGQSYLLRLGLQLQVTEKMQPSDDFFEVLSVQPQKVAAAVHLQGLHQVVHVVAAAWLPSRLNRR